MRAIVSLCFVLFVGHLGSCILLGKLSLPLALGLLLVSSLWCLHVWLFTFPFIHSYGLLGAVHRESCPNMFVLPKESITYSCLLSLVQVYVCVRSSKAMVKSLEVQQDSLYSYPLGVSFFFFFVYLGGRLVSLAAQM